MVFLLVFLLLSLDCSPFLLVWAICLNFYSQNNENFLSYERKLAFFESNLRLKMDKTNAKKEKNEKRKPLSTKKFSNSIEEEFQILSDKRTLSESGFQLFSKNMTDGRFIFSLLDLPINEEYLTKNKHLLARIAENVVQLSSQSTNDVKKEVKTVSISDEDLEKRKQMQQAILTKLKLEEEKPVEKVIINYAVTMTQGERFVFYFVILLLNLNITKIYNGRFSFFQRI